MANTLKAIQRKCEKLGVGFTGYPSSQAQVDWLERETRALLALIKKHQSERR